MIWHIIFLVVGFLVGFFIGIQPKISRTAEAIVDDWERRKK